MTYPINILKRIPVSFHNNVFLTEQNHFGLPSLKLDIDFYRDFFNSLQLVDAGFGRQYFEDSNLSWNNWTFDINNKLITIHSSNFISFDQHHPSIIHNFSEQAPIKVLDALFESLPRTTQLQFKHYLNTTDEERNFIEIMFINFLFSAFLHKTESIFNYVNPIKTTHFVRKNKYFTILNAYCATSRGEQNVVFTLFNSGNVDYQYEKHNDSLSPFIFQCSSFISELEKLGLNPRNQLGMEFAQKLFNAHLYNKLFYTYESSNEFRLRSLFLNGL